MAEYVLVLIVGMFLGAKLTLLAVTIKEARRQKRWPMDDPDERWPR